MTATGLARIRLSVQLLLERRVVFFCITDLLFLFLGVMAALGGSGFAADFWYWLFLFPSMVLGVPMFAEVLAVERRSGTLDLALCSPGANWYFERRITGAAVLLIAQGWATIFFTRIFVNEPFSFTGPLIRVVTVTLFLAATTLNWALRLKTAGAVVFVTYITAVAFTPWFFANPIIPLTASVSSVEIFVDSLKQNCVLLGAAAVFYLYAVQRLRNPELLIS